MKRCLLFLLLCWSASAAIPAVPVLVDPTNRVVIFPTNLWTANVAGLTNALDGLIGFDESDNYTLSGDWTFNSSLVDFTTVATLLLPPSSVTMCCSNAFVATDAASVLVAVQATNAPQVLANYGDTLGPVEFYDNANGDFWAEGIGQSGATAFSPLTGAAVSSGTLGGADPTADNQSLWTAGSSSSANSGYSLLSRSTHLFFAGREEATVIARFNATNTLIARGGFLDVVTATEPTDGGYWEIANGYLYGRTSSNSVRATTVTSNLLDQTSYYRIRTEANATGSSISFTLFNAAGTVLWTDSLATNIPAAASRAFGVGVVVLNTGTNVVTLSTLDAVGFRNKRRLTR